MTDSLPQVAPPPELLDALQMARRPLLVAHISPDGDALGSLTALGYLLYRMGKDPILACQDKAPHTFKFLPFYERITQDLNNVNADLMIALDCSDPSRMGSIYDDPQFADLPLVVIDHHITNVFFGDINWVEPNCCATAGLVFHLTKALDEPLDQPLATSLLTGIVTDTRGFRTSNVTPEVMSITSELLAAGAPLAEITERTLDSRSMAMIQLWGRVLDTVSLEDGVISATNTIDMRTDLGGLIRTEGLVSFILGAEDAQVSVVFTELPEGKIECSFRARPGYNVAHVAFDFGGGGHPPAAGCTIDGDLPTVKRQVLDKLKEVVRNK